ncbi:MAG: hypothetical protein WAU82_10935, partial [Candidatus Binatus sp.]|uniref:hypothetical protein n=1 Tax=Candidatus Binatus sp. TaxID=2811406 RepID=UPI003BAF005B
MTQSQEALLVGYQLWRHFGESVLFAGIAAELVVIATFDWWFERRYAVSISKGSKLFAESFCTALILVGVVIENGAAGNIDRVINDMRVGMTQRLNTLTPRNVTLGNHKEQLIALMSSLPPQRAAIVLSLGQSSEWLEANRTAVILGLIFEKSNWLDRNGNKMSSPQDAILRSDPMTNMISDSGISVEVDNGAEKRTKQAAQALIDALSPYVNVMPGYFKMAGRRGALRDLREPDKIVTFDVNTIVVTIYGNEPAVQM